MFSISLRNADHTRHYSIGSDERSGWEVKLEEDCALTRRACYQDWHRVERALADFKDEVSDLTAHGWQIASDETVRSVRLQADYTGPAKAGHYVRTDD